MARDTLGQSEFVVLGVLARRARGAHGTALLDDLQEVTGREWSVGALYTTLERLEKKGFASSEWGEPTAQRGGRRKRIYQVQAAGLRALDKTHQVTSALAPVRAGSRVVEA
jgi:PadR family transcriptional regulator, regulatory protein PadR